MEGPSFYCAYLGFSAVSKPPTTISVLQAPIKDLYLKYRKTPASGPSANLKIVQKGVLVVLFEDGAVKAELFFDFSSVVFVEAAKFSQVKTSSDRKPKAMFVPVDESKGVIGDKHSFSLEKSFHFLVSSSHPPLVVCVVRRPTGVKALDCHVFALDTVENALHITALIGSTQMPVGQLIKSDSVGDIARGKGNFDRGGRGDVIRTDRGEYSVYRGPQIFDTPPSQKYTGGPMSDGHQGHWYSGGPMPNAHQGQWYSGGVVQGLGRNGHVAHTAGWTQSPVILTQENFRQSPSTTQHSYSVAPMSKIYTHPSGQSTHDVHPVNIYHRHADVIVHAAQRSAESYNHFSHAHQRSAESSNHFSHAHQRSMESSNHLSHAAQRSAESSNHLPHDRSFNGPEPGLAGVRERYDDVSSRSNNRLSLGPVNESRVPGGPSPGLINRFPDNQIPPGGRTTVLPPEATPAGFMRGSQWQADSTKLSNAPSSSLISSRVGSVLKSTSPREFDSRDSGGPVYSASNLESRGQSSAPEPEEHTSGGRPVAKVPPHMKGIKVLPSDFRMVKLKPKAEKHPESQDEDSYDNNMELTQKYRELQEHERDSGYAGGMKQFSSKASYPESDGFNEFSENNKVRHDDRSRDFMSQWNESVKQYKATAGGYGTPSDSPGDSHRHVGLQHQEDAKNRNNQSHGQDTETGGIRAQSSNGDPHSRTKDLEIENMFSNFSFHSPNNNRNIYKQPGDRNQIEEGLGYLP